MINFKLKQIVLIDFENDYSILRAMFSLGEPFGYLMPVVQVLNPLDRCFLMMGRLFPLDFAFFIILAGFIVVSAVSGICRIGIGIPWIKVTIKLSKSLTSK